MRSWFNRKPLVMTPAIMLRSRTRWISRSRSGWSSGSPPLKVSTPKPSAERQSMRRSISAVGTGGDMSSYSLQYLQARLQRRIGMTCAAIGCEVDASAFTARRNSRALRPHLARIVRFAIALVSQAGRRAGAWGVDSPQPIAVDSLQPIMPNTERYQNRIELLQGTLDMLVL